MVKSTDRLGSNPVLLWGLTHGEYWVPNTWRVPICELSTWDDYVNRHHHQIHQPVFLGLSRRSSVWCGLRHHTQLSQGNLSFRSFFLEKEILLSALLYIWDKNMGLPADQEKMAPSICLIFTQETSVVFMKDIRLVASKENTASSQDVK